MQKIVSTAKIATAPMAIPIITPESKFDDDGGEGGETDFGGGGLRVEGVVPELVGGGGERDVELEGGGGEAEAGGGVVDGGVGVVDGGGGDEGVAGGGALGVDGGGAFEVFGGGAVGDGGGGEVVLVAGGEDGAGAAGGVVVFVAGGEEGAGVVPGGGLDIAATNQMYRKKWVADKQSFLAPLNESFLLFLFPKEERGQEREGERECLVVNGGREYERGQTNTDR